MNNPFKDKCHRGHTPILVQVTEPEWSAQTMGKSDRADNADDPPQIGGFGQLQPGEATASSSLLFHWIGEFLSYSRASPSSSSQWSNNERLNNASPCCHEHDRRWRGSSQLLHRCRWICGSVGQKYQRDSAGIIPDIHCITQYW